MRKLYLLLSIVAVALLIYKFQPQERTPAPQTKSSKAERIDGYFEDLKFTSSDVDLGYIPYEKLYKAIEIGRQRIALKAHSRSQNTGLTDAIWRERGPNNIGGRTRSIMIDESDPTRNRIWIGSVGGGVWRTEDISQADPQWVKMGYKMENISIGAIAQDPNNHSTIYVGTGEGYGNIDARSGIGIFKSTDDGQEWNLLSSTTGGLFQNVHEMYVHTNGDVYATTQVGGVLKSKDGGLIWEKVLFDGISGSSSDNFFDFQFSPEGNLFFASNENSVFKSPTGDRGDWTNIGTVRPGFPTNLSRVEFAVCPSDPQIIYVLG